MVKRKKIAAYFRRSTKSKGKQENSIERQQKALEHFLKAHSDEYELAEEMVFIEDGVSGDDSVNRPVFNRVLEIVQSSGCSFSAIFVSSVDRWGRFNALRCETYVWPLVENEIELCTPDKIYKWDESGSGLYYLIFSSFSYQNNEDKASKVVHGTAKKIENCDLQLHAAHGLKKREDGVKGLVIDKENSWVIKRIFSYFLQHESQNRVVNIMNRDKIPSPSGKTWSIQTIRNVLSNEKYAGFYVYGVKHRGKFFRLDGEGQPVKRKPKMRGRTVDAHKYKKEYRPDLIEPIIDRKTFEKVQLLLARRYIPYPSAKGVYRYTGIAICSECGLRMRTRKRKDGIRVWCCPSGVQRGCRTNEIKESLLDDATYQMFSKFFLSPNSKEMLMQELGLIREGSERTNKELEKLKKRYSEAQGRLTNFNSHLPDGFLKALEALSVEIEEKRAELQHQTSDVSLDEEAELLVRSIGEGITVPDRDEVLKREWLEKYVKQISVEYHHIQRGKKCFNVPKAAKYTFIHANTIHLGVTSPLVYQFPEQPLRKVKQKQGRIGARMYQRNQNKLVTSK